MLVDKYLVNLPNDIHQEYYEGKILNPENINDYKPNYVIVLANSATTEIKNH